MRIKRLLSILAALCLLCSSLPVFEASAAAPMGGMFDVQFGRGMVLDCQRLVSANTGTDGYEISASNFRPPYSAVTNELTDLGTDYLKLEYVGTKSEMDSDTVTALDSLISDVEATAPVFKLTRYTKDGTALGDFSNVGYITHCGEGLCLLFTVRGGTAANSYGYFLQAKIQYGEGLQNEYSGATDETLTQSLGDMEVFPTLKQITVTTASGEAVTLYVGEGDTVESVKKQLQAKSALPCEVTLSSGGQELADDAKVDQFIDSADGITAVSYSAVLSGTTVDLPDGSTVTGSADGTVTVTDSHGTTTTIAPPAGGDKVTVNTETGEVTVPGSSTVKTDEGPIITLPQGGNVKPDGTVTVPEGGKVTITDGTDITTITPPRVGEIIPSEDGGVHVDKGTTVQTGDGPVITLPESGDGGTVLPGGSVVGTPIQVGDSLITISAVDPTGDLVATDKDGNVTLPGGAIANVDRDGDGTPDATVTIPAGDGTSPAGSGVVKPSGDIELPGGGSVAISDGSGATTKITVPENGGTVTPGENGAVTVPGGSTVETGGETVTIPDGGGIVAPDGEVTYTVTVTFDSQGGSSVASQTIPMDSKAAKPSDPTRSGYTFDGWYTEAACTTEWNFNNAVTGNMTLYALWTKKPSPVTPGPSTPDPDDPDTPDDPPVWENPFTDIRENDWYYAAVEFANENGLFYGTSDTTFSPNDDMSRSMLVTVLYRLAKEPGTSSEDLFNDVADGKYYAEAVAWAAENNIVAGYGSNRFGPEDSITREQLATILWRYAGSPESAGSLDGFTDGAKTGNYAVPALKWAVEQKIVSGKGGGILDPRGKATRAEVAAVLMRYCS